MQFDGKADPEAGRAAAAAPSPRKRVSSGARKVTIRLSEKVHSQLEAATERPGVGKSMVVEAALAQFMNPARPPAEIPAQKSIEDIHARFDSLERDLRTIAETVALHARYHLAVMPPLPQQQQREASQLGDERFKVLAEQVDRRVREGRPLLQETIDRLKATPNQPESISGRQGQRGSEPAQIRRDISTNANTDHEMPAAAGEGGSNPNFRYLPNSFC